MKCKRSFDDCLIMKISIINNDRFLIRTKNGTITVGESHRATKTVHCYGDE